MRRRSVTGARQIGHLLNPRAQASQTQKWPQPRAIWSGAAWHTTHSLVVAVNVAARRASSRPTRRTPGRSLGVVPGATSCSDG